MRVSSLELTTVRHVLGFLVERTVEEIILSKTKVSSLDCDLAGKNPVTLGMSLIAYNHQQISAGQANTVKRVGTLSPFFSMKKKSALSQEKRVGTLSRISPFTFAFYETSNVINAK